MDAEPEMYCRYRQGLIDIYNRLLTRIPKQKPRVIWLAGSYGCGKTRAAWEMRPESRWMNISLKWFDGYSGQKVAIFDYFRKDECEMNFFIKVIDRYIDRVPVKGGFVHWNPEVIVITCSRLPSDEYRRHNIDGTTTVYEHVGQIIRRLDVMREWSATEGWIDHLCGDEWLAQNPG